MQERYEIITSEQQFLGVVEQVDAELQNEQIPIHARPIHAILKVGKRVGEGLILSPLPKIPVENVYSGPSLSTRISQWYKQRYGDRLKVDPCSYTAVMVREDIFCRPSNAEKGKSQVPSKYVFPSPRTEKQLVEIKYSFARAVKQAKITDLRFHDRRHTAATRMGDAGADAFTLAAIFGWSDIRMAMRYTHAMEDAKRRAVEAIAIGATRATRENAAVKISRDRSVTNEKRQAVGPP